MPLIGLRPTCRHFSSQNTSLLFIITFSVYTTQTNVALLGANVNSTPFFIRPEISRFSSLEENKVSLTTTIWSYSPRWKFQYLAWPKSFLGHCIIFQRLWSYKFLSVCFKTFWFHICLVGRCICFKNASGPFKNLIPAVILLTSGDNDFSETQKVEPGRRLRDIQFYSTENSERKALLQSE